MKAAGIIAAGWGERLGQPLPKALTPVGGRALIDYALDGLEAAGVEQITCIVNEAAREVPAYVERQKRRVQMDWIVQTTPSSMHSFLIVLERLARWGDEPCLMATVDSVCPPALYRRFAEASALFPDADVSLGLTSLIDDEKPLRVAMRGNENTGLIPGSVAENPAAFEIVALTGTGFASDYVTSGFYCVRPRILAEKDRALAAGYTALRQYLGHLLKFGYRFYGVPLPPVVDVDRPQDVAAAERLLEARAG
jgi:NDP-sugar pyrophosphorylase family protein